MTSYVPNKIISGAQTGADRGGLDAACALGLSTGGYVTRGRRAEDGVIPNLYEGLVELRSASYPARTVANVKKADATAIFCYGPPPHRSGSRLTLNACHRHARTPLLIDLQREDDRIVARIRKWLDEVKPPILNVAGTRESAAPGIQTRVRDLLVKALCFKSRALPPELAERLERQQTPPHALLRPPGENS